MTQATITEVSRHFSDFINRVSYRGENFTLMKGKKPVAELRPIPRGRTLADLEKLFSELPSLDDDSEAFSSDLEEIRQMGNTGELEDPWE